MTLLNNETHNGSLKHKKTIQHSCLALYMNKHLKKISIETSEQKVAVVILNK